MPFSQGNALSPAPRQLIARGSRPGAIVVEPSQGSVTASGRRRGPVKAEGIAVLLGAVPPVSARLPVP